jgi:thioredoxin 1
MKIFDKKEDLNTGIKLLDFYAEWCGPCKTLIPKLEELSSEYNDIEFIKINVDENVEMAQKTYNIRSVPTVLIIKDGEIKHRFTGDKAKEEYKTALDNL